MELPTEIFALGSECCRAIGNAISGNARPAAALDDLPTIIAHVLNWGRRLIQDLLLDRANWVLLNVAKFIPLPQVRRFLDRLWVIPISAGLDGCGSNDGQSTRQSCAIFGYGLSNFSSSRADDACILSTPSARSVVRWFVCTIRKLGGGMCSPMPAHARAHSMKDLGTPHTTQRNLSAWVQACWRSSIRVQTNISTSIHRSHFELERF